MGKVDCDDHYSNFVSLGEPAISMSKLTADTEKSFCYPTRQIG